MKQLFENKYKLNKLKDLLIDDEIIDIIETLIEKKELNIVFHGKEQTGKTTIIETIIKDLKSRNLINDKNIYLMNNMNEQTFVQNFQELKIFCSSSINKNNFKLVIIDDLNNYNENNQQNLKSLIENTNNNIFFIFTIDYIYHLIEPLQTQLFQIYCNGININKMENYIKNINNNEELNLNDEKIKEIIKHSNNNYNIIMNYIEKIYLLEDNNINNNFFINIEKEHFEKFLLYCRNNNFNNAHNILIELSKKGYFFIDILEEFYQYLKNYTNINYKLIELICKYINYFYDGYDHKIQYYFFTNDMIKIINN